MKTVEPLDLSNLFDEADTIKEPVEDEEALEPEHISLPENATQAEIRDMVLVKVDAAKALLLQARDAESAKAVSDAARAAEVFAQRRKAGQEAVDYAHTIVVDAETAMGEFLKTAPKADGGDAQRTRYLKDTESPPGDAQRTRYLKDTESPPTLADMGISKKESSQAQILAKIKAEDPKLHEMVRANKVSVPQAIQVVKRAGYVKTLAETTAKETEAPTGLYDVVVMDPPWPVDFVQRDERPNQAGIGYPTMTLDEIRAESPVRWMAPNCHLFLWTTQRFLPAAITLLADWGIEYNLTFVWKKNTGMKQDGRPYGNCEFCVYAKRGTPRFVDTKDFFTCFEADATGHSIKPDLFYDTVRRVTGPTRRLDMYNRRAIDGFTGWGKEAA